MPQKLEKIPENKAASARIFRFPRVENSPKYNFFLKSSQNQSFWPKNVKNEP